jgi:trimeric autotransporter adhesin
MKRFLSFLALTLLWPIWRAPAWAQLTTLGVGGIAAVVIGTLITPSIVPQVSSYFNQSSPNGATNNALKPNGGADTGAVESFGFPSPVTNSHVMYVEGQVNSALNYSAATEAAISGGAAASALVVSENGFGQPAILVQRNDGGGLPGSQWWNASSSNTISATSSVAVVQGTGYATGQFPFTAAGGGCAREPSGVWAGQGGGAHLVDPGFLCGGVATATADPSLITGVGGVATTCASNSPVSGQVTVTTHVAVAHGIAPGQTFPLTLFTPSALNTTYTALPSPTPTTLVGTAAIGSGSCPSLAGLVEGKALSGVGATITMIPIVATNPFGFGATGITTRNGQKFCGIVGEYGADSNFPGAQFASFVDDRGNPLPGAPALVPWLNQGTASFTGYVTIGTQSPSTPALHVTAMNATGISNAAYNPATGNVAFTLSASNGFIPGSEFTVSSVSSTGAGSFNLTYVAVAGGTGGDPTTNAVTGTTLVGNPLSGPLGTPQTSSLTSGSVYTSGGSMVSVIIPNVDVLGTTSLTTGGSVIAPYGTFGSTGTGGVGTYALTANPATATFTGKIDNGAGAAGTTLTTSGGLAPPLVVGTAFTGAGVSAGTIITAVLSANTFAVNNSQLVATAESMTNAGTIGSSGASVTLFAFPNHYLSAAVGVTATAPWGGVTTPRTQATLGDFWNIIGSTSLLGGQGHGGWGGALANVSMLWGAFPQATGGAPDTTKLAALCKKAPNNDLQSFAAANNLTVHSLYKLNDPGIWADSGNATITGYIDSATNSVAGTATLHVLTTPYGSLAPPANETAILAAPGLAGVPLSAPTIPLVSSGATATYTVTFAAGITSANLGSSGSPVTFSVGAFKPATPIASNSFNGYIDNGGGSTPTLHVTSLPSTATATFTATLGNTITGNIPIGNTLNVTAVPADGYTKLGVGTTIIGAGVPANTTVTGILSITNPDGVGSYSLSNSVSSAVASEAMFATGVLPAAAANLMVSAVSAGTISASMVVSDGGVNITGSPLFISAAGPAVNSLATWILNQTYYSPNTTYSGLVGTLTTLVPGQYIQGATSSVGLTT